MPSSRRTGRHCAAAAVRSRPGDPPGRLDHPVRPGIPALLACRRRIALPAPRHSPDRRAPAEARARAGRVHRGCVFVARLHHARLSSVRRQGRRSATAPRSRAGQTRTLRPPAPGSPRVLAVPRRHRRAWLLARSTGIQPPPQPRRLRRSLVDVHMVVQRLGLRSPPEPVSQALAPRNQPFPAAPRWLPRLSRAESAAAARARLRLSLRPSTDYPSRSLRMRTRSQRFRSQGRPRVHTAPSPARQPDPAPYARRHLSGRHAATETHQERGNAMFDAPTGDV